jgi:hypothetical protein
VNVDRDDESPDRFQHVVRLHDAERRDRLVEQDQARRDHALARAMAIADRLLRTWRARDRRSCGAVRAKAVEDLLRPGSHGRGVAGLPDDALTIVDFPAPLSPISATTAPA